MYWPLMPRLVSRVESGQFKGYALDFAGGDARLKLDVKELFNRCITDVMEGKLTATEKRAAEAARLGSSVCLKLERTGVDAISASPLQLQCRKCGLVWSVKKPSASRLPSGYWKCGNGCNATVIVNYERLR